AHYLKLVLLIALIGSLIGAIAGTWLGRGLTRLYAEFFHFPFLIFERDPRLYLIAAGVSFAAASLGALRAVSQVLALAPAVAMQPPAPPRYTKLWSERLGLARSLSQLTVMALRYMVRGPVRAATTLLGVALATSLLITSLFTTDSVEDLIDLSFFRTARQHATLNFTADQSPRATQSVAQLPGVLRAEPFRAASVRLRNGHLQRDVALIGKPPGQTLNLIVDQDLRRVEPPATGIMISTRLAEVLNLRRGDQLEVELLEGRRTTKTLVVEEVAKFYLGLGAYMDIGALDALLDDGPRISGVHVALDEARLDSFYDAVKATPAVASLALQRVALVKFRETIARNINIMTTMYIALSVIIAFGVVYNSARIQLSERARELASLRVLGFTRSEVSYVLLVELLILILLAQPLGWVLGKAFAWAVIQGFSSDLFTVPFVIQTQTYAFATLIVCIASAASALIVRRRIDRLDLVAVLKTRD
ncbi:MAG: FtsX-like permease family protein, partial [Hyphomicrobium sp.]